MMPASKSEAEHSRACVPSVSVRLGFTELTRIFLGPSSLASTPVMDSTAPLVRGVDRRLRRRDGGDARADVDDAAALAEMCARRLRHQQEAQHVDVEHFVELRLGDRFERRKIVDARVVDQDVEAAKGGDRGVDQAFGFGGLGDVALYGDGSAALACDGFDYVYPRRFCWTHS